MKHSRFAEMNNVSIKVETSTEQPNNNVVTERVETSRAIVMNPFVKMSVIGGGILLLVVAFGSIINSSLNAFNTEGKIEPTAQQQTDQQIEEPKNEAQKDKTLLALTTQSNQLKNIREQKAQSTPTVNNSPTPAPKEIPTRSQPIAVQKNPPPPPPVAAPKQTVSRSPQITTSIRQTTAPAKPQITSSVPTPTVQADPMQQWQAVADAGSFRANNDDIEQNTFSGIEGGSGQANTSPEAREEAGETIDHNSKRILVGSTSNGKLETPIVWTNDEQSSQNYLVRITSEVKASDGTVVVPVNSYLVVSLANTNTDGYAQLYASAILINSDGDTIQKKLPSNAVRILASNGHWEQVKSK